MKANLMTGQNRMTAVSSTETPLCEIKVEAGKLVGRMQDGIRAFLSVPYAAPPVGDLRFAAPAPVQPWEGSRDARVIGPNSPQKITGLYPGVDLSPVLGTGWVRGDDFLTLNIWTPKEAEHLPVLVYIHGGALTMGSKDSPVYDGARFARSGVVVVNINYRLGMEGFLPLKGGATNIGLRDAIASLQWVKRNIAVFGGDPDNVTICGESGGAVLTSMLVVSPLTKGLFRRAIVMSGHGSAVTSVSIAQRLVNKLANILNVTPDVDGFRSKSFEACVAATTRIMRLGSVDMRDENGIDPGFGQGKYSPVYGDDILPAPPLQLLAEGAGRDVGLLIGTTADEANAFLVPLMLDRLLPGFAAKWLLGNSMPNAGEVLKAYGLGAKGKKPGEVLSRALTDLGFVSPSRQFAEAHQGKTHVYQFDWKSNACGGRLGAAHSVDLGFVFNTLPSVTGPQGLVGTTPPQALADRLHTLWTQFIVDGSLPWPEYDAATRKVHLLAADRTVHEPVMSAAAFLPRQNLR
jgi:para-nitrobenzyl esterase